MPPQDRTPEIVYRPIKDSGMTIYDDLDESDDRYLDRAELEAILKSKLKGLSLNYPLRTRSKVLKAAVCRALGYPVPESFRKTRPRFPGQNFDTYVQKSNNLQIWNEAISAARRYVLVRVNEQSIVTDVKVVTGETVARLDPTGTLTQKFQAKSKDPVSASVLHSARDTVRVRDTFALAEGHEKDAALTAIAPTDWPTPGSLRPVRDVYERLLTLTGREINDPGADQERNRGAALHRAVCEALGYDRYQDRGQFPDVMNQLLEVKLQTSPTIDLGLVTPESIEPITDFPQARHCDVRYAVFYGTKTAQGVRLEHLVLTTGEEFFRFFRRFEGKVLNKKLQIPLPASFFDETE